MTSSKRHSAKLLSTTMNNSIVAMVTDLWRHLTCDFGGAWRSKMLSKIHTMEKIDFLKLIIHLQIIQFSDFYACDNCACTDQPSHMCAQIIIMACALAQIIIPC